MSRLSCNECYKQSFHCGHQKDQDLISYLPSFIQDISTQCEKDIIKTLGDLGDKIAFLFFSIKDNIRAQFQISQSRLQILNSNQINQMLGQLVELSNVKKDLTEIEVITQNLEDTLNQKLINLASKETTYQKPSCQQSAESTNYFIEGLTLFTKGDYQQALSSFNTSLRCNPNNIDVMLWKGNNQNQLGECLFSTNQFNDALMQFKQVWKLDSTNSKSLYGIGNSLYKLQQYKESIDWLDQALNYNPQNFQILSKKGDCLKQLEKYQEAITFYDKALYEKPDEFWILQSKGSCLIMQEKYRMIQSLQQFQEAYLL
ncbi:unnamed protein product (macronuclear) [Paramecium tetraurelia]|uniref:Uncharacterized protein n=1 Tax=Paramecium tetraurelia TaxID=5888 RepID=A0CSI8_PARTE|nr:uncharacterized protein GSPATT00010027001 [Paramecium tetraurelia]CAK73755.1 unnamed protein product [Paramecium tetraurelia]|eukprot:XP_001441152.1 hypothetical protein (macronuclear) [Paramecium tetraurelia strain d4-2]